MVDVYILVPIPKGYLFNIFMTRVSFEGGLLQASFVTGILNLSYSVTDKSTFRL